MRKFKIIWIEDEFNPARELAKVLVPDTVDFYERQHFGAAKRLLGELPAEELADSILLIDQRLPVRNADNRQLSGSGLRRYVEDNGLVGVGTLAPPARFVFESERYFLWSGLWLSRIAARSAAGVAGRTRVLLYSAVDGLIGSIWPFVDIIETEADLTRHEPSTLLGVPIAMVRRGGGEITPGSLAKWIPMQFRGLREWHYVAGTWPRLGLFVEALAQAGSSKRETDSAFEMHLDPDGEWLGKNAFPDLYWRAVAGIGDTVRGKDLADFILDELGRIARWARLRSENEAFGWDENALYGFHCLTHLATYWKNIRSDYDGFVERTARQLQQLGDARVLHETTVSQMTQFAESLRSKVTELNPTHHLKSKGAGLNRLYRPNSKEMLQTCKELASGMGIMDIQYGDQCPNLETYEYKAYCDLNYLKQAWEAILDVAVQKAGGPEQLGIKLTTRCRSGTLPDQPIVEFLIGVNGCPAFDLTVGFAKEDPGDLRSSLRFSLEGFVEPLVIEGSFADAGQQVQLIPNHMTRQIDRPDCLRFVFVFPGTIRRSR